MLAFVGFLDWEQDLLEKAANELEVAHRCEFRDSIEAFNENGSLNWSATGEPTIPALVFLNVVGSTEEWRDNIKRLKAHHVLAGVPIVGLGNLPVEHVPLLYGLGASSYIDKPETFEEMTEIAAITLRYWLEYTKLPKKFLDENHLG
ncbi:MAG: hypothetical protein QNJ29_09205 [Rhizobiaceae bacterium]|nr:hypothetical protein [Rhizobiaceae bacterium]